MSKKFTKDCRKIAVCLYGQYRTGDYVLPYMQKTAQQVNYSDVDFFCSGKQSNSYAYSQSAVESGIHVKKVMPAKKVVQSIINSKLDAKKINCYYIFPLKSSVNMTLCGAKFDDKKKDKTTKGNK